MSTETLTRFSCDAPSCDAPSCHADGIGHNNITPPDGWIKLQSTAHIPVTKESLYPARRNRRTPTYTEQCYGGFSLHLCPDHHQAFADHHPITNRHGSNVKVGCSCGAQLGIAGAVFLVNRYPAHAPEMAWFQHLPAELRWYLWRGQRQWAIRERVHGTDYVFQYPNEERARKAAEPSRSSTPQVVYRDAEGDSWVLAPAPATGTEAAR